MSIVVDELMAVRMTMAAINRDMAPGMEHGFSIEVAIAESIRRPISAQIPWFPIGLALIAEDPEYAPSAMVNRIMDRHRDEIHPELKTYMMERRLKA